MYRMLHIRKHEVGLWFRRGDFHRLLEPGNHRMWFNPFVDDAVTIVNTLEPKFEHELLEVLIAEPALASRLIVVDLQDEQRALVWKDGRLGWVLKPGRHAFWSGPAKIAVETFDVNDSKFVHPKIEAILNYPGAAQVFTGVRVEAHERALVFADGELIEQVDPGLHVYWLGGRKIAWKAIDLREQVADVVGQEIMTADKVTLRVNLVVAYRVVDPLKAVTIVNDHAQALYREAQLVLREAVGGRALEKLLADKDEVGSEVRSALASRAEQFGVSVRGVGLRDIILPGEMKSILNEVILAQKQAEANLIRRREDTAAARSQANTAKLIAENPTLARMRELEAIGDVLKGVKATFVFGKGDLVEQVRGLTSEQTDCPLNGGLDDEDAS